LAAYEKALALKPDLAEAWLGQGNVCHARKRRDNALAAYDRSLALKPDFAEAWLGRGHALIELRQWSDAVAAYDKALALKPSSNYAASLRLFAKLQVCDWADLKAETAQLLAATSDRCTLSHPFTILAISSSGADHLRCARDYVQALPTLPPIWRGEIYSHDRIRVAYLSADFHEHPVAHLTVGLFEHHDKSRFEITGISIGADQNSAMRHRIKSGVEHFIDAQDKSSAEIADLVRQLEIDIVVDLMGFTINNRLDVLAWRPAPIQLNYLGYPGTMGAGYIDYILADTTIIPEDQRRFYSEEVVWLPESYQVNDSRRAIAERTPTRRECGLPDTGFVFCCFHNNYKITPKMFDIWMRLLKEVDGSVLWLKENEANASRNLRREAEQRGVAPARLVFAPHLALHPDHLARYRQANVLLDTLPYNAHTTASDALWAGVPVLTCCGVTFAGRVAASVLNSLGLDDLVARSLEEYEALALKLARDASYLKSMKERLARNSSTFPLFNSERSTRQIEDAYTMMWERYQRGEKPKAGLGGPLPIGTA
jgi:predicted O-linked N-acetylglucosamine transferase (SPINDLY family)